MASYTVRKSFVTRNLTFREGAIVEWLASEAKAYVKLGWLEPIKKVTKRESKGNNRSNS